jgi:hypothetical protein
MSDDSIIPIAEIKAVCPKCGVNSAPQRGEVDLKDETRIFCPTHGDIGSLKELRAQLIDQNRDKVIDAARDLLKGFKLR